MRKILSRPVETRWDVAVGVAAGGAMIAAALLAVEVVATVIDGLLLIRATR